MGILMPLVVPLCWAVMHQHGLTSGRGHAPPLFGRGMQFGGSGVGRPLFADSDTTVLSSMASGCDHIEHVRTQMPYAALVGGVALFLGTVPAAFGVPPLASLVSGCLVLWALLRVLGRSAEGEP